MPVKRKPEPAHGHGPPRPGSLRERLDKALDAALRETAQQLYDDIFSGDRRYSIKLDAALDAAVRKAAKQGRVSPETLIREAVRAYLGDV